MTDKTKIVSVRLEKETVDHLDAVLKTRNTTLRELLTDFAYGGVNTQSGPKTEGHIISVKDKTYDSLMSMIGFYGGSIENLIDTLDKSMMLGTVVYNDGSLIGVPEIDLDRYLDVCHDMNVDPQETIYKVAQMVERGQI